MIRRTFALVGAAVLTLGVAGMSGSAAAEDNGVQVDLEDVLLSEIGVDMVEALDPDSQEIDGSFIELENTTSGTINIGGWSLRGCDDTTGFAIVVFDSTVAIGPGTTRFQLTADNTFSGSPGGAREDVLDNSVTSLEQMVGGVELADDSATPLTHNVRWGEGVPGDCALFDPAADTPTDKKSIHRDLPTPGAWGQGDPTPESQLGDKS